MSLSLTARWMLTVLISVGLQLCCCNLKAVLGGCCQVDQRTSGDVALSEHSHPTEAQDGACHHHHDSDSEARSDPDSLPSAPQAPCDQHGGCSCGTHDKAPNLVAKISLDISPVVVAILSSPTILDTGLTVSAPQYAELHGVFPPQSSLLRQHCALNL